MIEIRGLTKRYKDLTALDHLDLKVEDGDLFGFIGPNGAGKTTTLKILATLLKPDAGNAWVDGWSILSDGAKVRRTVGFMPDFFGIYDEMKVTEYLDFFGAAYGLKANARKQIVGDVLELTDLSYKRDALVQSLSRGMQQRLGLARVLIHDPKVLLLDEPASGLDPRARIEVKALLSELRQMGKTTIISSHILSDLHELCNKVGIIEKGKLVYCGTVDGLVRQMKTVRRIHVSVRGDLEAARLVLVENGADAVAQEDSSLVVELSDHDFDIARLSTALFQANLPVTRLEEEEPKLEDIFMLVTKGTVQ